MASSNQVTACWWGFISGAGLSFCIYRDIIFWYGLSGSGLVFGVWVWGFCEGLWLWGRFLAFVVCGFSVFFYPIVRSVVRADQLRMFIS